MGKSMILLQNGRVINGGGVGSLSRSHRYGHIIITINTPGYGTNKTIPHRPGLNPGISGGKRCFGKSGIGKAIIFKIT